MNPRNDEDESTSLFDQIVDEDDPHEEDEDDSRDHVPDDEYPEDEDGNVYDE